MVASTCKRTTPGTPEKIVWTNRWRLLAGGVWRQRRESVGFPVFLHVFLKGGPCILLCARVLFGCVWARGRSKGGGVGVHGSLT